MSSDKSSSTGRINSSLRRFLNSESSSGLLLMAAALLAIVTANSPLASTYFTALHTYVGPLSLQHWVNDALMAFFFLLVGLEIKREILDGHLSSWGRRLLPGVAAAGGMLVPALIYVTFNSGHPEALRGWAIPSATDIAFALGVLSLLGPRVPASLKVFLAALAIIDDLGAVIIIAVFYTSGLSLPDLGGAAAVVALLIVLNKRNVNSLIPYLLLGIVLWVLVLRSGIHATLAGVILALTIPIRRTPAKPEASPAVSLLHRLEHALNVPVTFLVVPIFGFANAGVPFAGTTPAALGEPLTLGIAVGLVFGKLIGVFGAVWLSVRTGLANLPPSASWGQMLGVSLLCGIGFTMSLFIGLLAFSDPFLQDRMKFGILMGSVIAGISGYVVLRLTNREKPSSLRG
ncbi:Na+/H+ antiporter NhaA (plasmid) [Bradyrhizobium sp. SK17]|uniref:Na+/H+ antiporter NhaA n=1 Tax=Bradyrhizobium sp. SK17 TaxID=2057741 RepID=UPI000C314762|nr:Na+/H+ antiporter NhaA [Bradyrhizobium sp. SK17]AUD00116.1 Na+/H+ antiporter NhaA [Bradyrhizobium sp. SK17]MBN8978661.1 Na+/H+ antiporter NhaA [Hyphomicrobiales bacterium]